MNMLIFPAKSIMAKKTNSRCLPDDVIFDGILIRLPVKDLLRFKRVCKRWRSFISSPRFVSLHFDHSTSTTPAKEAVLVRHSYQELPIWQYPSNSVLYWLRHEILVGSVNGFVAVVVSRNEEGTVSVGDARNNQEVFDIWIWNPATGMSKKLPLGRLNGFDVCRISSFGFGWDPNANVYKLVKFVYGDAGPLCEVWSSDSDSWTKIVVDSEILPPSIIISFHPEPITAYNVCVRGGSVVCWIFKNTIDHELVVDSVDCELAVASFDISSDVLKITPFPELPVSFDQLNEDFCNLNGVFGINWKEDFALVERYTSGIPGNYTLWVLDVEEERWTEEASFVLNGFSMGCLDSSKEKLLLMASKRLALCDIESGKVDFVGSSQIGGDYVCEARLYHESLLSLDGFVTCKEEWKI